MTDQNEHLNNRRSGDPTSKLIDTLEQHRGENTSSCFMIFPIPMPFLRPSRIRFAATDSISKRISFIAAESVTRKMLPWFVFWGLNCCDMRRHWISHNTRALFSWIPRARLRSGWSRLLRIRKFPSSSSWTITSPKATWTLNSRISAATSAARPASIRNIFRMGCWKWTTLLRSMSRFTTALTHGIITDTHGFVYAKPEDFQAAAFLSRFKDAELIYLLKDLRCIRFY